MSCVTIVLRSETDAIYGNEYKYPVAKMSKTGKLINLAKFFLSFLIQRLPFNSVRLELFWNDENVLSHVICNFV